MRHFKVVLLGAGGVGKTSMTTQFVQDKFEENYEPTIEEIHKKVIQLDGEQCMLELVDTAGMDQFTQMREMYIRNGDGFILVYSILDPTTFEDVKSIREQIVRNKYTEQVPIVLVGNKRDLAEAERAVDEDIAEKLAARWPHCRFIETSAREHYEVEDVFLHIVRQIKDFENIRKTRVDALHKEASTRRRSSGKCSVM
uniref:Ras-related protein Rap-1b n=1 Tax=Phallusia mammillata TaxID=59560 RepID=A0A6F9DQW5_9ASCI|nr:ras-related protein Rap-1b [Phallusia mammillata]